MENLIELLHDTVAFFIAIRIFVVFALVILVARFALSFFQPTANKKQWHDRKRDFIRPRNYSNHSRFSR